MAGLNYGDDLVTAGAQASTDFAHASAQASINFNASAHFKRGMHLSLGIGAFTEASAGFSKFIEATLQGSAFASARAGLQLQFPFNLFGNFGLVAKAEAIAEAGAGVKGRIGLKIGDFIRIIERQPELQGLPLQLIILFLEEVAVSAAFEIQVSVAAKAHAFFKVAGRAVPMDGQPPGFFFSMGAGAGLLKGVAKSMTAGIEFSDFRRFYGRAVDRTVDTVVSEVVKTLPVNCAHFAPLLNAFCPFAKIACRTSFEIGTLLSTQAIQGTAAERDHLCNATFSVILEEIQRFMYGQIIDYGCKLLQTHFETNVSQATWDNCHSERHTVANLLLQRSPEPFQPTAENIDYWKQLVKSIRDLAVSGFGSASASPELEEIMAMIYAVSELMFEAMNSKINRASAFAGTIFTPSANAATQAFNGPLANQPSTMVRVINTALGNPVNRALNYQHLLEYITRDVFLNDLTDEFPPVKAFMAAFNAHFPQLPKDLLQLFLTCSGAFVTDPGTSQVDPRQTLLLFSNAINEFINNKIRNDVFPFILEQVGDPMLRTYLDEVLLGAVIYSKDIGLQTLLHWDQHPPDKDDYCESLSSVLMLLLGRSVIVIGDAFFTHLEESIQKECDALALEVSNSGGRAAALAHLTVDPDLKRLIVECLHIGGEVLGPLEPTTRSRLRTLLYQTITPLNPSIDADVMQQLSNDLFIPNAEKMMQLSDLFRQIAQERFVKFALRFAGAVGRYILELLEQFIQDLISIILNWENTLANSLLSIAATLRNLDALIEDLNRRMIAAMVLFEDAWRDLMAKLGASALRNSIRTVLLESFAGKALGVLEDNDIYRSIKHFVKDGVENKIEDIVDGLLNNPVVNPVFNAIDAISNELDALMPEFRTIRPQDNIPVKVLEIFFTRLEERLRTHFGSNKPRIQVSIDFTYQTPCIHIDRIHLRTHNVHIPLGHIELPFSSFFDKVEQALNRLDFISNQLNAFCFRLGNYLALELERIALQIRKEDSQQEENRLKDIDRNHNTLPKEIAVLSPVEMQHFINEAEISIHLGEMGLPSLGLNKGEQQTVFISLNGKMIAPKDLVAELGKNERQDKKHLNDFDIRKLAGFNAGSGTFSNQRGLIVLNTAVNKVHKSPAQKNISSSTFAFNHYTYPEHTQTLKSFSAGKASNQGLPFYQKTHGKKDSGGNARIEHSFTNLRPGRGIGSALKETLLDQMEPGLFLSFRAGADSLVKGLNILHVFVIDRGGTRNEKTVSFSFNTSAPPKKDDPIRFQPLPVHNLQAIKVVKKVKAGTFRIIKKKKNVDTEVFIKSVMPFTSKHILEQSKKDIAYMRAQETANIKNLKIDND